MQSVKENEKPPYMLFVCYFYFLLQKTERVLAHSRYIILYNYIILTYTIKSCLCTYVILPELVYILIVYELSNVLELKNASEGKVELKGSNVTFIELKVPIIRLLFILSYPIPVWAVTCVN